MLLELAAANEEKIKWKPRWYYILVNKTTNKKYVGQTTRKNMSSYCGSGIYWKAHCKKYGGYNVKNIKTVEKNWIENKEDALTWLLNLNKNNPLYFSKNNKEWANLVEETIFESPFCGFTKEQRKEYCKKGWLKLFEKGVIKENGKKQGQKNAESGHIQNIQKRGAVLGGRLSGAKNIKKAHGLKNRIDNCKKGGYAACKIKHYIKDDKTNKSVFAINMGIKSGETKKLFSLFCKEHKIDKPGKNYINVDRKSFNEWRKMNDCRINACESSVSSNKRGDKQFW
jgi:hypothetical protein